MHIDGNFEKMLEKRAHFVGQDLNFVKGEIATLGKAGYKYDLCFYSIEMYNLDISSTSENTSSRIWKFIRDLNTVCCSLNNVSFCYASSDIELNNIFVYNKIIKKSPICVAFIAVYNLGQTSLDMQMALESKFKEELWEYLEVNVNQEEVIVSPLHDCRDLLKYIDNVFLVKDLGAHFFMFNRSFCNMLPFFKVFLERMYYTVWYMDTVRESFIGIASFSEGVSTQGTWYSIDNEKDNIFEFKHLKIMEICASSIYYYNVPRLKTVAPKLGPTYVNVISLNEKDVGTELGLLNSFRSYLGLTDSFINNGKVYQKIKESRYSVKEIGTILDVFRTNISHVRELLSLHLGMYINMKIFDANLVKYGDILLKKIIDNNALLPVYDINWNVLEFKDGIYFMEFDLFFMYKGNKYEKSIREILDINFSGHYYDINYKSLGKPQLFLKFLEKFGNLVKLELICASLMFKLLNKSCNNIIDPVKNVKKPYAIHHFRACRGLDLGVSKTQPLFINSYTSKFTGLEKQVLKDLNTQNILDKILGSGIIVEDDNLFDNKLQGLIFKLYKFSIENEKSDDSLEKKFVEDIFLYHFLELGKNTKFKKYEKYMNEIPKILVYCNKQVFKYYSKDVKKFKKKLLKKVNKVYPFFYNVLDVEKGRSGSVPIWCYQSEFHHEWKPACGPKPFSEDVLGPDFFPED